MPTTIKCELKLCLNNSKGLCKANGIRIGRNGRCKDYITAGQCMPTSRFGGKEARYMAQKAQHECYYPGCHVLTRDRYCDKHKRPEDKRRPSAAKRGYGSKWDKARKAFLAAHPTCQCAECVASGHPLQADVVDHIIPHRGNSKLFWDTRNWQAMNHVCHNRKTARENGGFGNDILK